MPDEDTVGKETGISREHICVYILRDLHVDSDAEKEELERKGNLSTVISEANRLHKRVKSADACWLVCTCSGKPRDDALVVYGNLSWSTQVGGSVLQNLLSNVPFVAFLISLVNEVSPYQVDLPPGTLTSDLSRSFAASDR
jgi:hypothetical protein